ncbi:putative serine threonine-protein kinase cbk1 protein [Neofusicoccum parvum UCRNP2]|uniref:non-specific serine/threonine protein kinase n=1 Tax=Botryosphaeria parva (strain UCR-NP2) TaxID=1287680 RepID=R1GBR0_BOTPV|nr:putative serine threonine-protein kinase cbk1 protein [Neofusicoccum parvum UCRNP2]
MKQRTLSFGARTIRVSLLSAWSLKESEYLRNIRVLKSKSLVRRKTKGISVAGYEVVRVLGKGSFGVVRLVREKGLPPPERPSTEQTESDIERLDGSDDERGRHDPSKIGKQVFAMKVIRKSDMLRNCQEGHLRAERDFLVASENSRWVVPLVASFQDNTNLYLVMEYMLGGDFLGLLMREDILDETTARWYVAEMILCIEEAHKMKWIHRDIKPDNFLITSSGHLKISDFGLAFDGHWAHNQTYFNEKRYNLLKKFGIDVRGDEQDAVDEVNAETKNQVFGNVVNAAFGRSQRKPSAFSLRDQSTKEPPGREENPILWMNRHQKRRLAKSIVGTSQYMAPEVIRDDAREIKEHPFFRGIDWGRLHLIRPPFVPQIRAGQDLTKYFDDETQILSSGDNADDPDADSLSTSAADANSNRAADRGSANAVVNESELLVGAAGACAEREKTKGRAKNRKEKRRPRDKLLRDPLLKRQVMEARKKGAFVGT